MVRLGQGNRHQDGLTHLTIFICYQLSRNVAIDDASKEARNAQRPSICCSTDLLCALNCVESIDWAPPKLHLNGRGNKVLSFRDRFTQIVCDRVSIEFLNERLISGFTFYTRGIKIWAVERVPKCWEIVSYEATRASIVSRKPGMESAQATPTSLDDKPGLSSPLTYDGSTLASLGSPKTRHGKKWHS